LRAERPWVRESKGGDRPGGPGRKFNAFPPGDDITKPGSKQAACRRSQGHWPAPPGRHQFARSLTGRHRKGKPGRHWQATDSPHRRGEAPRRAPSPSPGLGRVKLIPNAPGIDGRIGSGAQTTLSPDSWRICHPPAGRAARMDAALRDHRHWPSSMPQQRHSPFRRIECTDLVIAQLEKDLVGGQVDGVSDCPGSEWRLV
jgi:hypothetical protein